MSLGLPEEKQFELAPADTHIATCYRIVDLGTQQFEWQGKISRNHQIMISWELNALMEDGRPFSMHRYYNYSFNEKSNLRIDLESWRGRPFTEEEMKKFKLCNLFGVPCMMGVVHETKNGKTKAKISSIMKLPKGMEAPALVNPTVDFDLGDFKQAVFDTLSDGLKEKISLSPEYQHIKGQPANDVPEDHGANGHTEEEIPF